MDHPEIEDFITVEGPRGEEGARRSSRPATRATSTARPTTPSAARTRTTRVRVTDDFMKAVLSRRQVADDRAHHRRGRRHARGDVTSGARSPRPPGLAPIRACSTTRTINQWHTCPNTRKHQRVEPVLRVHVPRRHGVQPVVHEPHQVPRSEDGQRSTSRATATPCRVFFIAAGDPGRSLELPDQGHRAEQRTTTVRSASATRTSASLLDAARHPLRLGRRAARIAAALTAIMCGHAYADERARWRRARAPSPASPRTASRCCG